MPVDHHDCTRTPSARHGCALRSVEYYSCHLARRLSECPEGARYNSPGQASRQASVALGQRRHLPEPCKGEIKMELAGDFQNLACLFRPVGASDNLYGCPTQGDAPRGLGACPGLYYVAPVGLRSPNQALERNADSASLRRHPSAVRWPKPDMLDDPRIKRVLKRYRKNEQFSDAQIDVSSLGDAHLLEALRCRDVYELTRPRELDHHALACFARHMGIEFDGGEFDYFLHSYVRSTFLDSYYKDPAVKSKPAPEGGPPAKIPLPAGTQWFSVRPKDGEEHYEAYDVDS